MTQSVGCEGGHRAARAAKNYGIEGFTKKVKTTNHHFFVHPSLNWDWIKFMLLRDRWQDFPKKWHGDALEPHNDWILTGTPSDWKLDPKHKKGPNKLSGLCFLTFLHLVSCHCASHLVKPMHILLISDLLGGSQICWYVRSSSGGKRFDVRCWQMPKGKIETKQVVSPWKHFISIISDQEWKGSVQSTTRALTVQ